MLSEVGSSLVISEGCSGAGKWRKTVSVTECKDRLI